MKTVFAFAFLAFIFVSCTKTSYSTLPQNTTRVKQITSTSFEMDEQFFYANGQLNTYTLFLFGSRKLEYNIHYDHLNRPIAVEKDKQEFAQIHYSGNTISISSDDGIKDSLVYTLDGAGRILKRVSYDNFHNTMLKNGSKTYSYNGNNLTTIEGVDFNKDGSVKFSYTETAFYDNGKNALECSGETTVLMEFIFQHFPKRVFAVNSQNNVVQLQSNHSSDGYFLEQNQHYSNLDYPDSTSSTIRQFGTIVLDNTIYEYN